MTTLNPTLLARLADTDEIGILTRHADGNERRPVTVWVVRAGDDAYVRSLKGADGAWYRYASAAGGGALALYGTRTEVRFTHVPVENRSAHEAIDKAFRAKYSRYGTVDLDPMLADRAVACTLRIDAAASAS
jgi:hypothetical protein